MRDGYRQDTRAPAMLQANVAHSLVRISNHDLNEDHRAQVEWKDPKEATGG